MAHTPPPDLKIFMGDRWLLSQISLHISWLAVSAGAAACLLSRFRSARYRTVHPHPICGGKGCRKALHKSSINEYTRVQSWSRAFESLPMLMGVWTNSDFPTLPNPHRRFTITLNLRRRGRLVVGLLGPKSPVFASDRFCAAVSMIMRKLFRLLNLATTRRFSGDFFTLTTYVLPFETLFRWGFDRFTVIENQVESLSAIHHHPIHRETPIPFADHRHSHPLSGPWPWLQLNAYQRGFAAF